MEDCMMGLICVSFLVKHEIEEPGDHGALSGHGGADYYMMKSYVDGMKVGFQNIQYLHALKS